MTWWILGMAVLVVVGMFLAVALVSIDVTDAYRQGWRDGEEGRPFNPSGKRTPLD